MVVFHLVILLSSLKRLFAQHRLRGNKSHFRRQCRFNGLILNLFQTWGNREANLPFNGENVNSKCIRLLIYPFTNLIHRREWRGGAWAWLKFTSHLFSFSENSFSSLFKFIFALNLKLFSLPAFIDEFAFGFSLNSFSSLFIRSDTPIIVSDNYLRFVHSSLGHFSW